MNNRSSLLNRIWLAAVIILGSFFVYCEITAFITPLFMVHPNSDAEAEARVASISNVSSVSISSGGYTLSGYFLDRESSDDLIIFFGGISENAALDMERFLGYEEDGYFTDYDIAIVDWPGYGRSEGRAAEESLKNAACDIVSYFSGRGRLYIMAYSMGTGPATYAASRCGCDGLVLIAPYESALDLYNAVVNIFHGPFKQLLTYKMETGSFAASVDVVPLIIAGTSDSRVPYESSVSLAMDFPAGCEFASFEGLTHGELPDSAAVLERISTYLDKGTASLSNFQKQKRTMRSMIL